LCGKVEHKIGSPSEAVLQLTKGRFASFLREPATDVEIQLHLNYQDRYVVSRQQHGGGGVVVLLRIAEIAGYYRDMSSLVA